MNKEGFYKVWKDSSREDILNQYYYDRKELQERLNKVQDKLKEKEKYFIQMSEVLLDRIDFYEDFENDKSSWIEELRTDREKLQDKIDKAIEYINEHKHLSLFADCREPKEDWIYDLEIPANELLDILKGGKENE
jgi:chromosome segregation ATPase